jgi:hypothetical protein
VVLTGPSTRAVVLFLVPRLNVHGQVQVLGYVVVDVLVHPDKKSVKICLKLTKLVLLPFLYIFICLRQQNKLKKKEREAVQDEREEI